MHPEGPLISVESKERARLKELRLQKGWRQEDLALKASVTAATISNLESGRSNQLKRDVYARIVRALKADDSTPDPGADEFIKSVLDGLVGLSPAEKKVVNDLVISLKNR